MALSSRIIVLVLAVLFSLLAVAPLYAEDELINQAWSAFRARDYHEAEKIYLQVFTRLRGSHSSEEMQLIERLAVLYASMGVTAEDACKRLSGDSWENDQLLNQMVNRCDDTQQKNSIVQAITKSVTADSQADIFQTLEANVAAYTSVRPNANPRVLHGFVQEESSRLPAVAPEFRAGALFTKDMRLKALSPDNFWYRVPLWSAGTWHSSEQTNVSSYNFKTSKAVNEPRKIPVQKTEVVGLQNDNTGQVWDLDGKSGGSESDDSSVFDINRHYEIVESNNSKLSYKLNCTRTLVQKNNNRIIRTFQIQAFGVLVRDGNEAKVNSQSLKTFDQQGEPEAVAKLICVMRKVEDYHPVDTYDKRDVKNLFKEYMIRHPEQFQQ
ncbi:MAG: hypothetical protein K2W95_25745 [Candidatus Obscuribacterales bacterium]|nr:hypothetical protein [Candidatus Obscuribacterales bacterium]